MTKLVLITSTAHEVHQVTPLFIKVYICRRCDKVGYLNEMFNGGCTPHFELETSGWRHNEAYPKIEISDEEN